MPIGNASRLDVGILANDVEATPTQLTKTVTSAGTPEVLAAAGTYFRSATLMGKKAARTDNTGNVFLGIGISNDTQPFIIAPGEQLTLEAPEGVKFDLNDWGLDVVTDGDGLIIIYS